MPNYEYRCPVCGVFDYAVSLSEFDNSTSIACHCGATATRQLSVPWFSLSWAPPNKYDDPKADPWEGTPLEGGGEPDPLNYTSEKIFVDQGTVTQQGGKTVPRKDWLSKMPEGFGT